MLTTIIILGVIILVMAGGMLRMSQHASNAEKESARLTERDKNSQREIERLNAELVEANNRHEQWKTDYEKAQAERDKALAEREKQAEDRFKLLAAEIMDKNSRALQRDSEAKISELLNPLKSDIEKFRNDVNNCYSKEAQERHTLQERIKDLIEANNSIGREARELSTALRGNSKVQGDWGEMLLESILEKSGLRKDIEFKIQEQSTHDENGRALRPDVVVNYPGGKVIVIDSKVSLTAFTQYINAEDEAEKEAYGKQHLRSVEQHIAELAQKRYQDYVGDEKLDFVMMFVPNEGAYAAAMTLDPTLWQKAYDKRVLIVSPTQLVGALKVVSQLWSHDRQTKNAIEIAEKSGRMYDKFIAFVEDMQKIEKQIAGTQHAYDEAMKKLRDGKGSLISRAETLLELGVKAEKQLKK